MKKEEFIEKITIKKEELDKADYYLRYRGIDEHEHVRKYLESMTGRKVSYCEIATAFRYDKRIRRVLYEYIGFIEEMIRAYILNKYSDRDNQLVLTKEVYKKKKKYHTLYIALSESTLGELKKQVLEMTNEEIIEMFPFYKVYYNNFEQDLNAVVELRNQVSHNRFLLDNKNLKNCSVGDGGNSLWANIVNLCNCLPDELREKFTQDINECSTSGDINNERHQVGWVLIDEIVIRM